MAESVLQEAPREAKKSSGDLVRETSPDDWDSMSAEEKAVVALAPLASFALVLDDGETLFEQVSNLDVARVLKALVDRAELVFGIPGRSTIGSAEAEA